jgi:eukaryotic-like serine/threonine-protein kinase
VEILEQVRNAPVPDAVRFAVGDWQVDVTAQELRRGETRVTIEPRQMLVLAALCRSPGAVLSADSLIDLCWPGQTHGDNPVHKAIATLRRVFEDSATAPHYIETIRKQGYRLIAPTRVVSDEGARSHRGGWSGRSPFRGLEAFDAAHANVFFGRDDAVTQLRERLDLQWRRGSPLVVLLGPSGSGKTSLVQAGLLPALAGARAPTGQGHRLAGCCCAAVIDLGVRDDDGAWGSLAGGLLDWDVAGVALLSGYSIASLSQLLRADCAGVIETLRLSLQVLSPRATEAPPLLVLDRLEALFQAPAQEQAQFVRCLETLVDSGLLLLLAVCRNDFYAGLASHGLFVRGKGFGSHLDLESPDAAALAQIIRLPARAAGLAYGMDPTGLHRLDDRLCADAMRAPDALPLLQYTLQSLYAARDTGGVLSWEAYDELGGLEGAIAQRAEAVLALLPASQQNALPALLSRLVGQGAEDGASTSRWMRESEFSSDDEVALARAFVAARLFVADAASGNACVRVAHEALLRRWPRVTAWIAQHRGLLAVRGELLPWVRRWEEEARAPAALLSGGPMLWRLIDALARAPALFNEAECEFVTRSRRRLRRQGRIRWIAASAVVLLALVAVCAAIRSAQLARVASQREAESRRLAGFMLGELADGLRPLGKLDLLGRIGEQGVSLLGQTSGGATSGRDALDRAKALIVLGEVNGSRGTGRVATALSALHEADALLAAAGPASATAPGDYYKTVGASAFWQAQIALDAGRFDDAALQMGRYRSACEQWRAAASRDPQAGIELGFAFAGLGNVAFRRGAWAEASRWFERSLELKLAALAQASDDADRLNAVANTRASLGELAYIQGDPRGAQALYDAVQAVLEQLRQRHPEQTVRRFDAAIGQVRRAETLVALGRPRDAEPAIAQAADQLAQVARMDPNNRRWAAERLNARSLLAATRQDAGSLSPGELGALRSALDGADPAIRAGHLWRAADARALIAETALAARQGDVARARSLDSRASQALAALLAGRPNDWQGNELLARLTLGETAQAAPGGGLDASGCALRVHQLQPAVDSGQAGVVLEAWLRARQCLGITPDAAVLSRLSGGGYRARTFPNPSNPGLTTP